MYRLDSPFYPPISAPRTSGFLALDDIHTMYWEECGNPDGTPLVIPHGGPGGAVKAYYRTLADPDFFRIILYDQRGCGQSTPAGELEQNTTRHLVEDLDTLRIHLGIEQWYVMGGSWSSTLSVAYAQSYPQNVSGMVITGVMLGREADDWWWWEGARFVYPEIWETLRDFLPEAEQKDIKTAYLKRILDPDPDVHGPAAIAMLGWEIQTLDVWPDLEWVADIHQSEDIVRSGRIFAHYAFNDFFLEKDQIIKRMDRIQHIPAKIINGRFDMCTPPRAAWDLHKAWGKSALEIVPCAGHRWNDPLLAAAVIRATDALKRAPLDE